MTVDAEREIERIEKEKKEQEKEKADKLSEREKRKKAKEDKEQKEKEKQEATASRHGLGLGLELLRGLAGEGTPVGSVKNTPRKQSSMFDAMRKIKEDRMSKEGGVVGAGGSPEGNGSCRCHILLNVDNNLFSLYY